MHADESGRSGTRYGSHAATPGDSTPSAPQTRTRRLIDRVEVVSINQAPPNPLDDVITSSKYFKFFLVSRRNTVGCRNV